MTLAFAATHLMLAAFVFLAVREVTHPAVMFPLVWGVILLAIEACQPLGYLPVADAGFHVFEFGTFCFAVPALIMGRPPHTRPHQLPNLDYQRLARLTILIHVVMLPLWWRGVSNIVEASDNPAAMAFSLRYQTTIGGMSLDFFAGNYLVVGLIITPILVIGALRQRIRAWSALTLCLPWVITNFLTNGRAGVVQLLLSLLFLYVHLNRRAIRLRTLTIGALTFALLYGAGAILVKKTDVEEDAATSEVLEAVTTNFIDYTIQGPILMSRILSGEAKAKADWDSLFQLKGKRWEHAEFNSFNRSGDLGNVYTIYFAQVPTYGIEGMVLLMLLYGAAAGYFFRNAWRSYANALIAAYLFGAVVLSVFTDAFAPSLNYLVKLVIVTALVQHVCRVKKLSRMRLPGTSDRASLA